MGQVLFEIVDIPIVVEEVTNKVARREQEVRLQLLLVQ